MGRARVKRRQSQIRAKQVRKVKLAALRAKYRTAATPDAKKKVLDKVFKVSPLTDEAVFLASVEKKEFKKEPEVASKEKGAK